MAGNEIEVCRFLFSSIGNINLKHIGQLREIGAPLPKKQGYLPVQTLDDLIKISTEDSRKKADIYLNGIGVSIKQIEDYPESERKTVHFLMIEKLK